MKKTLLSKKEKNEKVRCFTCQRRCLVAPGQWGFCQTRINKKGTLYSVIYGVVSSVNIDPIEKKPVYHFKPGSPCLSFGTYGCNFRCLFCQNYEISHTNGVSLNLDNEKLLSPEEAIKMAKKSGAEGIAWTYNEPAIWLEYSLDCAKLAKKAGLYTCWVTNGYATKEAIDEIAPYLDIYRVDLKSFDDKLYQKLIGIPQAKGVFETTLYVRKKYPEIHLECVTNIVPTWNDSDNNLKKIAHWIVKNLGKKTPWHVTRFFPYADLTNVPPTPPETLLKARKIGMKEGLEFVYIGNLPVDEEDDTFCPKCHNLAIRRTGFRTEILGVDKEGHCSDCGEDLNIRM
jgi:pyruvate formate lyase activating enzyme